jgi:hypothetical protein
MCRVLVYSTDNPAAVALARALTDEGVSSWPSSSPIVAVEQTRLRHEIGWVVVECTPSSLPLCQQLRYHRPDLEIIGVQADGAMARRVGCVEECELVELAGEVVPLLRARLE